MMQEEKVLLSKSAKIITAVILPMLIVFGIGVQLYLLTQSEDEVRRYVLIGVMVLIAATLIPCFMLAPRKIVLTDTQLVLHKGVGKLRLSYADMESVSIYRPTKGVVDVRTFGIGGIFGFIGYFYNKQTGHYIAYVGDYSQAFLVRMKNGKKYMLSCGNHQSIVAAVKMKSERVEWQV